MRCLSCKYDLSHLTEHRCPECGRAFDPNDSKTYDTPSPRQPLWMRSVFSLCAIYVVTAFLLFALGLPSGYLSLDTLVGAAVLTPIIAVVYIVLVVLTGE